MDKKHWGMAFAALALLAASQDGLAQTSTTATKETTTADMAAKVASSETKTTTNTLAANGLDTNPDGTDVDAYKAGGAGDPLHLLNCNGNVNNVETYNSNDTVWWVPYQKLSIPNLGKGDPRCATSSCWIKVNGVWSTAPIDGYWVVIGGLIRQTNPTSYAKGCVAYIPNFKP